MLWCSFILIFDGKVNSKNCAVISKICKWLNSANMQEMPLEYFPIHSVATEKSLHQLFSITSLTQNHVCNSWAEKIAKVLKKVVVIIIFQLDFDSISSLMPKSNYSILSIKEEFTSVSLEKIASCLSQTIQRAPHFPVLLNVLCQLCILLHRVPFTMIGFHWQ